MGDNAKRWLESWLWQMYVRAGYDISDAQWAVTVGAYQYLYAMADQWEATHCDAQAA